MSGQITNPFQLIMDRLDMMDRKIDGLYANAGVNDDEVYTVSEAAAHIKSSIQTVRKLIKTGQLPHVMVGRNYKIRRSDLKQYLKDNQ